MHQYLFTYLNQKYGLKVIYKNIYLESHYISSCKYCCWYTSILSRR